MNSHIAILEPFKGNATRHTCPSCNKRHEFVRYRSTETGEYIADHVGRCNRVSKCGYHYKPKQFYEDNKYSLNLQRPDSWFKPLIKPAEPPKPVNYLPSELLPQTMRGYEANNLFGFLQLLFTAPIASKLMQDYSVGSSRHWAGANIFWQVDTNGRLRQAKIMLYNPITGRRVKDEGDRVFFAGKAVLNNNNANLQQCFFGEYLLTKRKSDTVAIVESEKTAMIASIYFPSLVWLATGGSHGCRWTTKDVCQVLSGRQIILFPDVGFHDKWNMKAEEVRKLVSCKITVSDLLEKNANDEQRESGWDLADYLLMNRDSTGLAIATEGYPIIWDLQATEV